MALSEVGCVWKIEGVLAAEVWVQRLVLRTGVGLLERKCVKVEVNIYGFLRRLKKKRDAFDSIYMMVWLDEDEQVIILQ